MLLFQSGWFIEGLLSQTLVVHMLRTPEDSLHPEHRSAARDADDRAVVMALGIYVPFSPLGAMMVGLQPLP